MNPKISYTLLVYYLSAMAFNIIPHSHSQMTDKFQSQPLRSTPDRTRDRSRVRITPREKILSSVVNIDLRKLRFVTKIPKEFLSFMLDSKMLSRHWKRVDLQNRTLIELTRGLTPAYLRVGGTEGDNLRFCPDCPCENFSDGDADVNVVNMDGMSDTDTDIDTSESESLITGCDIALLAFFAIETNVKLIYGLNVLHRKNQSHGQGQAQGEGQWDPENSLTLMKFTDSLGIDVVGWELGNEPLRFGHVFNKTLSGGQLGRDFNTLKKTLLEIPRYSNSKIFGPDITHIRGIHESENYGSGWRSNAIRFLDHFLKELDNDTLSTATFHDYYFPGQTSTVEDFMDTKQMKKLHGRIKAVKKTVHRHFPKMPVWFGETASAWGGGVKNVSDRFVSTFLWLDKLGQSALNGVGVVIREVLVSPEASRGNRYGLIGPLLNPTPCYFISYIFKQLVGTRVLRFNPPMKLRDRKLRLFAHCLSSSEHDGIVRGNTTGSGNGGLVIYGMNLDDLPYHIKISGVGSSSHSKLLVEEYRLTAPGGNLTSRFISLNGKQMKVGLGGKPLPLTPRVVRKDFKIYPKTLGFWVIKNVNAGGCLEIEDGDGDSEIRFGYPS